jgi:hypothetical protein
LPGLNSGGDPCHTQTFVDDLPVGSPRSGGEAQLPGYRKVASELIALFQVFAFPEQLFELSSLIRDAI